MKISVLRVGTIGTNCYILESENKNGIIIDPGDNAGGILRFCNDNGINISMLVFTHGHFDHVGAMTKLLAKTDAKTAIHTLDEELMLSPQRTQSKFFKSFDGYDGRNADICFNDGEVITVDDINLKVMHTPGHTKGSSVLICEDVIFTGDTIFAGSVGRTDLYGGDEETLLASVKKIAALEGDYTLLTGHGESTKLSIERESNPYMKGSLT